MAWDGLEPINIDSNAFVQLDFENDEERYHKGNFDPLVESEGMFPHKPPGIMEFVYLFVSQQRWR